jgi:hypothetical protein
MLTLALLIDCDGSFAVRVVYSYAIRGTAGALSAADSIYGASTPKPAPIKPPDKLKDNTFLDGRVLVMLPVAWLDFYRSATKIESD